MSFCFGDVAQSCLAKARLALEQKRNRAILRHVLTSAKLRKAFRTKAKCFSNHASRTLPVSVLLLLAVGAASPAMTSYRGRRLLSRPLLCPKTSPAPARLAFVATRDIASAKTIINSFCLALPVIRSKTKGHSLVRLR